MARSIDEHDYYRFGTTMTRTYHDQFNLADHHIDSARFAGHRRDFLGFQRGDCRISEAIAVTLSLESVARG